MGWMIHRLKVQTKNNNTKIKGLHQKWKNFISPNSSEDQKTAQNIIQRTDADQSQIIGGCSQIIRGCIPLSPQGFDTPGCNSFTCPLHIVKASQCFFWCWRQTGKLWVPILVITNSLLDVYFNKTTANKQTEKLSSQGDFVAILRCIFSLLLTIGEFSFRLRLSYGTPCHHNAPLALPTLLRQRSFFFLEIPHL